MGGVYLRCVADDLGDPPPVLVARQALLEATDEQHIDGDVRHLLGLAQVGILILVKYLLGENIDHSARIYS